MKRPLIGLTANFSDGLSTLAKAYYASIERAGGSPVLLPPSTDEAVIAAQIENIDGILFTGGADVNPLLVGEEPWPQLGNINAERDRAELLLARHAYNRNIPMLGICRGQQLITLALGGTVAQDIAEHRKREEKQTATTSAQPLLKHSQNAAREEITHSVRLIPDTIISTLYNAEDTIFVNSFHHQAVAMPGEKLKVTAVAPDGIIEAVESAEHKPVLAVQWHPECLFDTVQDKNGNTSRPVFSWLVEEAAYYKRAKEIHRRIITLDSHCDTPMFFHTGVNLNERSEKVLVDFKKMEEGMLDVSNMVCYLPQPKDGEIFLDKIDFPMETPKLYADFILDCIEQQASLSKGAVVIAQSVKELNENKRAGRRSIMMGIENGLALEGDINNIKHFAKRGITYITLCHNGDNDICDSAKGVHPYGGLSDFGRQVVKEMNRLGILVDLSHASEDSFYDALKTSSVPIVCSHSNCRALCDHPRNLTDDQMRALANAGGVMQLTLYPGFLKESENLNDVKDAKVLNDVKDSKAFNDLKDTKALNDSKVSTPITSHPSIQDLLRHLRHAISVMGIDHVGIGTDFDGDGGVPGFACASDSLNLTMHLLKEGYKEHEIEKIWGGNWLKLLRQ